MKQPQRFMSAVLTKFQNEGHSINSVPRMNTNLPVAFNATIALSKIKFHALWQYLLRKQEIMFFALSDAIAKLNVIPCH